MKPTQHQLFHEISMRTIRNTLPQADQASAIAVGIGKDLADTRDYCLVFDRVYAVDADPRSYQLMQTSDIENLVPQQCVLDSTQKSGYFYQAQHEWGLSTQIWHLIESSGKQHKDQWQRLSIQTDTLDHLFLDKIQNLAFLKIDAEGSDIRILQGALELINCYRPVIQFEHLEDLDHRDWLENFVNCYRYRYSEHQKASSHLLQPK